jgi:hypothetical protein
VRAIEKHAKTLARYQHRPTSILFDQSVFSEVAETAANQCAVDQIDARAKYRPASGVTVIEVPKTADT